MSEKEQRERTLLGAGPPEERDLRLRWDALDMGTRWRIARTVERGEALDERREADLAAWLARARLQRGRPRADRVLAFAYPVLALVFVLLGTHPAVASFLVAAALIHFAQSARWPRRREKLEQAERLNRAGAGAGAG